MIYKYYPPTSHTFEALTKNYFFFNKATKQNDPFDTSFSLLQSKVMLGTLGYDQQGQSLVKNIMGDYGSCCFAKRCDNKHLWSFYSTNYTGLVIGYDETKFKDYSKFSVRIPFVEVDYVNNPITDSDLDKSFRLKFPLYGDIPNDYRTQSHTYRECLCNEKLQDLLFTHLCCIKEQATWAIEEEYRLIAALDVINGQGRLEKKGFEYLESGYKIPIPCDCVKEIIIGHNFDIKKIDWVKQIAKKYGVKIILQTKAEKPFKIEFVDITENLNPPIAVDESTKGHVEEENNIDLEERKFVDFIDSQQRKLYKFFRILGWIVCAIAIASIGILQLTDWRPLGEAVRYKEINEIILNLSYSYLAAYIFYIVMNLLPSLKRRSIIKSYLKYHKSRIRELITICINIQHPFSSLGRENNPYIGYNAQQSREEFLKEFCEKELTHLKLLESSRIQINTLVDSALFFQEFLSEKELENLLRIKKSSFLKDSVRPIEYTDDENRVEIPNNQREMVVSIYDIYELIKAIEK